MAGKEASSDATLAATRVEVPISAVPSFAQPQVHMTVAKAAKLLGFDNQEELRKFSAPLLKQAGMEPLLSGSTVGAQLFNRLVLLCSTKTAAAKKLFEELSTAWRTPGRGAKTKELPAEPIQTGRLPAWPGCAPDAVGIERCGKLAFRRMLARRTVARYTFFTDGLEREEAFAMCLGRPRCPKVVQGSAAELLPLVDLCRIAVQRWSLHPLSDFALLAL
ncbi:eprA1 [Symbiodinium sp. CCMP2456]|nr:eprA1 [Symbiodinium sp. CCMP2456]